MGLLCSILTLSVGPSDRFLRMGLQAPQRPRWPHGIPQHGLRLP